MVVEQADPRRQIGLALKAEKWTDALVLLEQWCDGHPQDGKGWFNRGFCLYRLGRLDEAGSCLDHAIRADPSFDKAKALQAHIKKKLVQKPEGAGSEEERVEPTMIARPPGTAPQTEAEPPVTMIEAAPPAPGPAQPPVTMVEAAPPAAGSVQPPVTMVEGAVDDPPATQLDARPDPPPTQMDISAPPVTQVDGGLPAPERLEGATVAPPVTQVESATVSPPVTQVDGGSSPSISRTAGPQGAPRTRTMAATFASDSSDAWEKGAVVGGRYEVRNLARGGMGVVYMALDRELDRMVAVKTPLPSTLRTADGRARFEREAEAWIALGIHPNICTAYYLQDLGDVPRLFVEYVDGGDLDSWLRDREMSLEQRLDICIQVARGMHRCHTLTWKDDRGKEHRGLVHRDLKPANVLMSSEGVARVTDFGLVRAEGGMGSMTVEESAQPGTATLESMLQDAAADDDVSGSWKTVTAAGGVLGTPPYVAPEIWRATARAGGLSDVYAFGCMLYEILCGRRPFVLSPEVAKAGRQAQLIQWLKMHIKGQPPQPRDLEPELSVELASLMLSCMAKTPENRPATFEVICDTLTEVYGNLFGPYPRPVPYDALLVADALNNSGVSYMTLGHAPRAERSWREARTADPLHPEATFNLAVHEWCNRGLTDAELHRRMEEVVSVGTATWRELHLLGKVHLLLDEPQQAVERLREATTRTGASLRVRRALGLALVRAANQDADGAATEAETVLAAVLEEIPKDVEARVALAAAYDINGKTERAEAVWAEAVVEVEDPPLDRAEAYRALVPGFERLGCWRQPGEIDAVAVTVAGELVVRSGGQRIAVIAVDGTISSSFNIVGGAKRGRSLTVTADGKHLLASGEGVSLASWELATGREGKRFRTQPGYVTTMAINADGSEVLTGGSDRVVRRWSVADGSCLSELRGHDAFVTTVAFASTGDRAFTVGGDGQLREWRLSDGENLRTIAAHRGTATALALTEDGATAITGGDEGEVRFWDLASGGLRSAMKGHSGRVGTVVIAPAVNLVISAGDEGTIRCWNLSDGSSVRVLRYRERINDLTIGEGGKWMAVAHGAVVDVVELEHLASQRLPFSLTVPVTAGELEARQRDFEAAVAAAREAFAAGADSDVMDAVDRARAISGYDQHPQVLQLVASVLARRPRQGLRSWMEHASRILPTSVAVVAAVSGDASSVVVATAEAPLRLFDISSQSPIRQMTGHAGAVLALSMGSDGREVAAVTREGQLLVWKEAAKPRIYDVHGTELSAIAGEPLGKWWVVGGSDGAVLVVTKEGEIVTLGRHEEAVSAVVVSPDGRLVASAGWDHQVILWEVERRMRLQVLEGHEHVVRALAMSPDGRSLASASGDGSVRLWEAKSGRCLRTLVGDQVETTAVVFTPDGRFIVSGDRRGRLRLWDHRSNDCVRVVDAHTTPVVAVTSDPSASRMVSVAAGGSVRVWRLEWVPELVESGPAMARVKPFFEVFLGLRAKGGTPEWTDEELDEFLADLARRGFGYVDREIASDQLVKMAQGWGTHREERQAAAQERHRQQERHERRAPVAKVARRLTRHLGLKVLGGLGITLIGFLIVLSFRAPSSDKIELNEDLFPALQGFHMNEARTRQTRGLIFSFSGEPGILETAGEVQCIRADRNRYLDVFSDPDRFTTICSNPALECGDGDFLLAYHQALLCLPAVADDELIQRLLDLARTNLARPRRQDLRTMLVQIGQPAIVRLGEALGHPVVNVRHTAAWALAEMRTPESMAPLVTALDGSGAEMEAAAIMLQELITAGALAPDDAFRRISSMAHSIDAKVRHHSLFGLAAFAPSRPVRDLLDEADQDPDAEVRSASVQIRAELREANLRRLVNSVGG